MPVSLVFALPLGANPRLQDKVLVSTLEVGSIQSASKWTEGYYAQIATPEALRSRGGADATLGVQFTGETNATAALLALGVKDETCDEVQVPFCDGQIDFYVDNGLAREDARREVMRTIDACKVCMMTKQDAIDFPPPFSMKANKYRGAQFISLGGGASTLPWTAEMANIPDEEIHAVRDAGFTGICFDIEAITGGVELADVFEDTFARCQQAGVDVFITTSHSAPSPTSEAGLSEAEADEARVAMVDAWAKSENVGYISPQLYSLGGVGLDLAEASGTSGPVGWERYKGSKAKFVPSIMAAESLDEMKAFFAAKGLPVDGFVVSGQVAEDLPSWAQGVDDDACRAHGFCGGRSKQERLALLARWV